MWLTIHLLGEAERPQPRLHRRYLRWRIYNEDFCACYGLGTSSQKVFQGLETGGSIALYEYDHSNLSNTPEDIKTSIEIINRYASMPSNARFEQGVLERLMASVGFEDI
jgi:hypothetical protein